MFASHVWAWILAFAAAYLCGAVSGSITVSKLFYKEDIRSHGSGNAGTTNMLRTYGLKKAAMTLGIDFIKTFAGIGIAELLLGDMGYMIGALGVTIGHAYPVYYKFKGGKAAACMAASMLYLYWRIFVVEATLFFICAFATRIVSVSTLLAAITFPVSVWFFCREVMGTPVGHSYLAYTIYICIFVFYLHRSNIVRLFNGTEARFGSKKGKGKE